MTNTRSQNRAKNPCSEIPECFHLEQKYIDFCEKEDIDPDCYTSAVRWIESRKK